MSLQRKERDLRPTGRTQGWIAKRDRERSPLRRPEPKLIPRGPLEALAQETIPPFSVFVESDCQDCGGRGYDSGGINPQEAEDCSVCHGSGKETILRNYLAEAFRIAANPQANLQLERAHLVALTAYARQTVNALMSVQEVA